MVKKGEGKLLQEETLSQKKVINFLNEKFRKKKSYSTKSIYGTGLTQFQTFLHQRYPKEKYSLETILPLLSDKRIKVYPLLGEFIQYLENSIGPKSIQTYVTAVRSYLQFESEYEVDISKFKDRVVLPQVNGEREQAINGITIGNILKACNNRRLKAFLAILSSSGVRSMEAISLRVKDIELSEEKDEPSIIHVRAQYAKTRVPRDVFITWEGTQILKQFLEFKYRGTQIPPEPDDIIFTNKIIKELVHKDIKQQKIYQQKLQNTFHSIYVKLSIEFNKILEVVDMGERKDGMLRRKVTFHSYRRFVRTTIADQVGVGFSEYILGHRRDMGYHTETPEKAIELYKQVMKQLTFLSIEQFQTTGKNIEKQMEQKDKEISLLTRRQEQLEKELHSMRNISSFFQRKLNIPEESFMGSEVSPEVNAMLDELSEEFNKKRMESREQLERYEKEHPEEYRRQVEKVELKIKKGMVPCPECNKVGYNFDMSCDNCGYEKYPDYG